MTYGNYYLSGDLNVGEYSFSCLNVEMDTGSMSPLSCLCLYDCASPDSTEVSILTDFLSMFLQVSSALWASHLIVKGIFSYTQ